MEKEIPKKIFYVWLGKNELPKIVKENLKNWQEFNPDFQIIRINESNFNISKYKYVEEAYKDKNWAFASDLVRLDVIYNNGGFYFDTDVLFRKNINNLCKYKSVWAMENSGLINSGLIIGAHKGDIDLKNIIDIYKQKNYSRDNLNNLITVKIITDYFKQHGLVCDNKIQFLDRNQIVFPTKYFAPYHWWGGGKENSDTIAIQEYLNSWGAQASMSVKIKSNFRLYFPKIYAGIKQIIKNK